MQRDLKKLESKTLKYRAEQIPYFFGIKLGKTDEEKRELKNIKARLL